jgi:hypothetical protein
LKHDVLGFHVSETELEIMIPSLDSSLLGLECFNFLTLAFPRGLSGTTVAKYSFDPSLLLFILGLGSLPMQQSV